MTAIDEIIENFSLLDEWDDRYRYLIELGRTLAPLPENARTDLNKVQGCASQVWLSTGVRPNGAGGPVLEFVGDSDSTWFTDEPRPDILSAFTANHLVYGFDWSFENAVGSTPRFIDLMDLANPADHAMILEYSERWFEHFTFDIGVRWVVASEQHITGGLLPLSGVYTGLKLNY